MWLKKITIDFLVCAGGRPAPNTKSIFIRSSFINSFCKIMHSGNTGLRKMLARFSEKLGCHIHASEFGERHECLDSIFNSHLDCKLSLEDFFIVPDKKFFRRMISMIWRQMVKFVPMKRII